MATDLNDAMIRHDLLAGRITLAEAWRRAMSRGMEALNSLSDHPDSELPTLWECARRAFADAEILAELSQEEGWHWTGTDLDDNLPEPGGPV